MTLSALLFDLDGTLIDTDELHLNAYNQLLSRWDRSMNTDYYKANVMGFPDDMIFGGLFPDTSSGQYAALALEKESLFRAQLVETQPVPGVLRILDHAKRMGIPVAVVTNAPRANAIAMLDGMGITNQLDALVIGGELARGKPDPLPYLTALEILGADVGQALAFEDSLAGVRSAVAAGIYTFGMLAGLGENKLREAGARSVIRDFDDDNLWNLIGQLAAGGNS